MSDTYKSDKKEVQDDYHKKESSLTQRHKYFLISCSVLTLLVYGSTLLVAAIANLQATTLKIQETKSFERVSTNLYRNNYDLDNYSSKRIGFKESRNSTFRPKSKFIQWISEPDSYVNDKGLFVTNDHDAYIIKSIKDDNYEQVLFNGSSILFDNINYTIDQFFASPDLKHALIQTNHTQHWRHSSYGIYWVLNVETNEINQLYSEKLSIAEWSSTSDKIAFVLNNNVYVYKLEDNSITQVTADGGASIFNGKPDWVYEEEVFEGDTALWWSPDGQYLSFLRTNDSEVNEFPIPYFVQGDSNDTYPELRKIKYPKAGFPNPNVKLALYSVDNSKLNYIDYSDDIFTEVLWVGNHQLLLKSTNRSSDFLKVVIINAKNLKFEIVRDEVTDSWFEITHDTFFVPKSETRDNDGYIDTISVDGFNHLAYFSPPTNSTPQLLTKGKWEVVSAPTAFDYKKNLVYYFSTQDSSIERHLYSVNLLTGESNKYTDGNGWYSASFSSGARFVSLKYLGPDIPSQKLVDLYSEESRVLESNDELRELLQNYDLPYHRYGEVDIGTAVVNYVEILPPYFDASKKYPILFFVYGGPGSQLVTKTFSIGFPDVVSSQLDAVVVTVDGRGTGFKGREFRSLVRDKLGYYEVIDQIAAAKHWGKKPYIDEKNVAMFGWSYGGYMTLKTLEADGGETFNYGMSVAPVTDFRLYDSVYTERYMHLPQDNEEGYDKTSVSNITRIGEAQRFLLMHGTGDDNVHFQNTLKVLDKFDLEGIENYDLHVFPDSDHAIRYHNADVIVYNKLLLWLRKAFRGDFLTKY